MTPTQYRKLLDELDLTIVGAASVLGISERQAQRLASGASKIPGPVRKLLRVVIKFEVDPKDLEGLSMLEWLQKQ
jgi:hypothetical protein